MIDLCFSMMEKMASAEMYYRCIKFFTFLPYILKAKSFMQGLNANESVPAINFDTHIIRV